MKEVQSNNSFDKNLDKWILFCQWSRFYPDLFYDMIKPEQGGLRLDLDQRVTLRAMCRFLSTYGVFPRGYGKTMIELMAIYHTCIFYPDSNLAMSAQTLENASSISKEKHDEMMKNFPMLQKEIVKTQFSKNRVYVKFASGSTYMVLANAQSTKGQRKHGLIVSRIYEKSYIILETKIGKGLIYDNFQNSIVLYYISYKC